MQVNQRGSFGRREAQLNEAQGPRVRHKTEHAVARGTSGRGWKDYAFYAVVGIAIFSAIGSFSAIMEDPDERNARLIAEAKADLERQRAAEVAAAERAEEAKRREAARLEAERIANRPPLKVHSWRCSNEHGFVKVHGAVTNQSDRAINRLMVTAIYTTGNGDVVKTSDAMVDFQPLLPGQRSPFSTMTTDNPAIRSCNVTFRTMSGGEVRAER